MRAEFNLIYNQEVPHGWVELEDVFVLDLICACLCVCVYVCIEGFWDLMF